MGGEFKGSSHYAWRVSCELRAALMDLGGVLLPTKCVGCGAWDEVAHDRCLAQILGKPQALDLELADVPSLAVANYEGAMRRFVLAGKHDPRLDLRSYSAAAGENAVALAVRLGVMGCHRGVFVVSAPSIAPGTLPPVAGAFAAGVMSELVRSGVASQSGVLEVLEMRPGTKKQAGPEYSQRVTNQYHRITLVTPGADSELSGVVAVSVDGVSATGSTLWEMAWALQGVGTEILGRLVFATSQFSQ